jgi:hypothetical protein
VYQKCHSGIYHLRDWRLLYKNARAQKYHPGIYGRILRLEIAYRYVMKETGNTVQVYHTRDWKYFSGIECQSLEIPFRLVTYTRLEYRSVIACQRLEIHFRYTIPKTGNTFQLHIKETGNNIQGMACP